MQLRSTVIFSNKIPSLINTKIFSIKGNFWKRKSLHSVFDKRIRSKNLIKKGKYFSPQTELVPENIKNLS